MRADVFGRAVLCDSSHDSRRDGLKNVSEGVCDVLPISRSPFVNHGFVLSLLNACQEFLRRSDPSGKNQKIEDEKFGRSVQTLALKIKSPT